MNSVKIITKNRRARYDYSILETYEAGIVLLGSEVKSLREGKVSLSGCYGRMDGGEAYLYGLHIPPYETGGSRSSVPLDSQRAVAVEKSPQSLRLPPMRFKGPSPERPRKLLLHRREINRLHGKLKEKGLTLVPLSLYFKKGLAKVELGLCKGKRRYEKREIIKKREMDREINSRE
jgi:SsrA-binding protein